MEKNKGKRVTKGPDGQKVKFPGVKHTQVSRGLALQLINNDLTETEYVDGEKRHFAYNLHDKIGSLRYDPSMMIPQMQQEGYLVVRTKDPESFYIFTSKQSGLDFRRARNSASKNQKKTEAA